MTKTVLLVGRAPVVVGEARDAVGRADVRFITATTIDEVRAAFADAGVDHVVMGGGLALEDRLEVVRAVFTLSDRTTVHMKDVESGPEGYLPFVRSVLRGLIGSV